MKIKLLYITAIISILFVSCKKYLEVSSPSQFTSDYIFTNDNDALTAIRGIYSAMNTDNGYSIRLSFYYNCNTDVEMIGISGSGGRYDIASFQVNPSDAEITNPWNTCYQTIDRANQCIAGIAKSSLYKNDVGMTHMYGEAVALRALMYYEVVRNWGDVPYKTTPTVAGDSMYLPRTERDTILSRCIRDLIAVEPTMLWSWSASLPQGVERVNREFVQGLIARIALFRGGYSLRPDMTMKRNADYLTYYQIADKYCKLMIDSGQHTLNPSFKQIFLNQCQYVVASKDDDLYEVAFLKNSQSELAYFNGIKFATGGTHSYGSASASMVYPPTYFYSFDTLDTRLPVSCAVIQYDKDLVQLINSATYITSGKWSKKDISPALGASSTKGTGINLALMRYSDVLLMYAETQNELNNGPTDAAKKCLSLVRARAFPVSVKTTKVTNYVDSVSANHDMFFNALVNERAWEFGGECIRKFDLVRWNLYGQKIAQARQIMTQMGTDTKGLTHGAYANYPAQVYTKLASDNKTLQIVGLYRKPAVVPPASYAAVSWLTSLVTSTGAPATYINDTWKGYQDATGATPVRYIFPINQAQILSSNGVLKNYYGY